MSLTFPKEKRILSRNHFKALRLSDKKYTGKFLKINYRLSQASTSKLGITVSKRYGNACKRNYFKRATREAFRKNHLSLPSNLELVVYPLRGLKAINHLNILEDLHSFSKVLDIHKPNQ